jgi:hypothetical protein
MPHLTGLKSNDILSSLSKSLDNSFKWAGNIAADVKNWDKGQPTAEKCAALNNDKIKSVKCDAQNNFMCETNTKPRFFCSLSITLFVKPLIICSIPTGFQIRPIDNSKTQSKNVFMVTFCKTRNIDQKITIGEKEYMIPSEKVNP